MSAQICGVIQVFTKTHYTMKNFQVPTREEVSENNQAIFDNLKDALVFRAKPLCILCEK